MKLEKFFNSPVKMTRARVEAYARRALEFKPEAARRADAGAMRTLGTHARPRFMGPSFLGDGEYEKAYYYKAKPNVAVVPVCGGIYHGADPLEEWYFGIVNPSRIDRGIRDAAADPEVGAIILDIDSPGGTTMGTSEICETLREVRQSKPVIAVSEGLMCSAAYEIACGADEIYASSGAYVGCVGVYMAWMDETGFWENMGFGFEVFKGGEHKGIGVPGRALTESDRAMLQAQIDAEYSEFKSAVRAARGEVPEDAVQGQDFKAAAALKQNLIDGVAKFDQVIALI